MSSGVRGDDRRSTVLITGAAGRLGRVLRAGLASERRLLRLHDRVSLGEPGPHEEVVHGDLGDFDATLALTGGVDTVVHLAGIPDEAPFDDLLAANFVATHHVFEAARRCGVRRVVFASSNHVIGFHPRSLRLDPDCERRPDTLYGVSKSFGEDLARLYHDKWGLEAVCVRIGSFRDQPEDVRQLSTWLSHRDGVHLFDRSIEAVSVGFLVVYGVSANTRSWWSNDAVGSVLGYAPLDDAESFADLLPAAASDSDVQGGLFAAPDYEGGMG